MSFTEYWTKKSRKPRSGEIYGSYRIEDFMVETEFSIIYSSTYLKDGSKKATKFIKCLKSREERIFDEIKILEKVNHQNILKLEYHNRYDPYIMIVTNLAPFKSLYKFTNDYYRDGMPPNVAQFVMRQMVSAVHYLHSLDIWHRDIKPHNFLVFNTDVEKPYIVLADLGSAKQYQKWETDNHFIGTRQYMSPELINHSYYNNSSDIWSLGVTFYFILTGQYAFEFPDDADDVDYTRRIRNTELNYQLLIDLDVPEEAVDIIRKMCKLLPEARITAQELNEHQWIAEANKTRMELDINDYIGKTNDYESSSLVE